LVSYHNTTQHHNSGDLDLKLHYHENLKTRFKCIIHDGESKVLRETFEHEIDEMNNKILHSRLLKVTYYYLYIEIWDGTMG